MMRKNKEQEKKNKFQKDVTNKAIKLTDKDIEVLKKRTEDNIRSLAMEVKRRKEWAIDGFRLDNVKAVMDKHHLTAEKEINNMMQSPRSETLKAIAEDQAYTFWLFRGAIEDSDEERMKRDYYDGKRYVGFLLADTLIESCKRNEIRDDCLDYLREDFFDYLSCLSVEEFIRIKAYYIWEKKGRTTDSNKLRMDSDYYPSMECVQNTMWNCKNRKPEEFLKKESMTDIKHFFYNSSDKLEAIKRAKINTGWRLNIELSKSVNEFVDTFYKLFDTALKGEQVKPKDITTLLNYLYSNTHIANMLEFILRCFLCTYVQKNVPVIKCKN